MSLWDRIVRVFRSRYVLALEKATERFEEVLLQWASRYELRIANLEAEKSKLLDRILLLTTGAPLEIPKNNSGTFDQPEPISTKNTDEPIATNKTLAELLRDAEAQSFADDLEDNGIPNEIVENASLTNALIDADEADGKRQSIARKNFMKAFKSAEAEYLHQLQPVLTPAEQADSGKPEAN